MTKPEAAELANVHLAPSSPLKRRMEAEACSLLAQHGRPAILCGDLNAFSITDTPPLPGSTPPLKERKKQDKRPAIELEEAGLRDMGAFLGNTEPTVGHRSGLAYRCDRFHTNLPDDALKGLHIVREDQPNSNHRPVVAELEICDSPG
ncbi:hypothetical protein AB0F17_50020 [Nonomuraea sp. NPDC026600]|uniref:hypothetical protein n=1 Tax=Nonomuraea sp. NPDC026600 TaxID=3155363 RepID=UPI0033E20AF6